MDITHPKSATTQRSSIHHILCSRRRICPSCRPRSAICAARFASVRRRSRIGSCVAASVTCSTICGRGAAGERVGPLLLGHRAQRTAGSVGWQTALESITRLDYPPDRFEVIVRRRRQSGHPTRHQRFRDRLRLTLLVEPHRGVGAARNAGARVARGSLLAFTSDDCAPASDWLRQLTHHLASIPSDASGASRASPCPRARARTRGSC